MMNNQGSVLIPMVMAIIVAFVLLIIGGYIIGTIQGEIDIQNTTNFSGIDPEMIDVFQVVIIITILTGAISVLMLFDRPMGYVDEDNPDYESFRSEAEEERITRKSTMRILRERYVNGKITKEEYTEKMARL